MFQNDYYVYITASDKKGAIYEIYNATNVSFLPKPLDNY